jgi:hypothetical protein
MRMLAVSFASLLVACGGKKKDVEAEAPVVDEPVAVEPALPSDAAAPARAPSGPPRKETRPTRTEAQKDCLRLLAGPLGLAADAEPYLDRSIARERDDDDDDDDRRAHLHTTESADADLAELRGAPPAGICIAWKRLDHYDCSEDPADCGDGSPYHAWKTRYVVAVRDREDAAAVTDQRTFESEAGDLSVEGSLRWSTVAIGPDADALVLTRSDESGDTSLARVTWHAAAGGALVDLLGYRHGTDGGMPIAEVEHEVLDEVADGRFVVRFRVKVFDLDDMSGDDPQIQEETCRFSEEEGSYRCAGDLLAQIPAEDED